MTDAIESGLIISPDGQSVLSAIRVMHPKISILKSFLLRGFFNRVNVFHRLHRRLVTVLSIASSPFLRLLRYTKRVERFSRLEAIWQLFLKTEILQLATPYSEEHSMIKFVLPAVMALAFCIPAASEACNDCCCPKTDCCKRQKRFEVRCVTKEVCRLKRVCVTDECGCTRKKLMRVSTTVTRKRLVRVNRGCGCQNVCGCTCDAGCNSGCDTGYNAVPIEHAPVVEPTPADVIVQ